MAYTVVVSLKQTMESLLKPSQSAIRIPNSEIELIYEDLCYLKSFFDRVNSLRSSNRVDVWEKQIKDVLRKTQDLIESLVADQFRSESESSRDECLTLAFSKELLKLKEELSAFTEMLKSEEEYNTEEDLQPSNPLTADAFSPRIDFFQVPNVVGVDDELMQLKSCLVGESSQLQVLPIVGMGGIGKTTLAKMVYHDPLVESHFDCQFFMSIGQEYQLKEILVLALCQVGFSIEELKAKNESELMMYLYKALKGRRYLTVLDDLWSTSFWDDFRRILPDDRNGSRIILTTRMVDVSSHVNSSGFILHKRFFDEDQSWHLLCQMVFNQEACPPELEEIGKKIAWTCRGLPLAITVVSGLLCITDRTITNWQAVAKSLQSRIAGDGDDLLNVLSLSYKQLPQHLKACFLYMGVFPEDYEIPASELIKLWVSEGFLEPQRGKRLDEVARECLHDLVSRSLVLVRKRTSRGRIKTCGIHDLYRDICAIEARKEKFFHFMNKYESANKPRRLCIINKFDIRLISSESVSAARSLLCFGPAHQHPSWVHFSSRLLRVIHALPFRFYEFPREVLKLARLKHLAITIDGELPASISKLRNLEVLIVHRHQKSYAAPVYYHLPVEIWNLHRLRHLQCTGFHLPDPSRDTTTTMGIHGDDPLILENLLTLSGVSIHDRLLARMPNLIKLDIQIVSVEAFSFDGDLVRLNQLDSFKCLVVNPDLSGSQVVVSSIPRAFPSSLRKISLSGCGFSWNCMPYIGSLPHLEVLKLGPDAFRGLVWRSIEGEFCRLKSLLLDDLDIQHWIADSSHFPVLESLIIRHCRGLEEIPSDIGEILTLRVIRVIHCSDGVAMSAVRILEEQESFGNEDFQVRIEYENEEGVSLIEEKIEDELGSFISSNLQITSRRY